MADELFNPWQLFVGSMLPNWLLERRELTLGAKVCYARLCQYAGRYGVAYPTQVELAESLGVSERHVRRYLDELQRIRVDGRDAPLITLKQRGLRRSALIVFHKHPWMGVDTRPKIPSKKPDRTSTSGLARTPMSGPIGRDSLEEIHNTYTGTGSADRSAVASITHDSDPRRGVGEVLSNLTAALSMPGTQLPGVRSHVLDAVRARLDSMPPEERDEVQRFSAWLLKTGCDHESTQVIVADLLSRSDVENPYAYYAVGSEARSRLTPR